MNAMSMNKGKMREEWLSALEKGVEVPASPVLPTVEIGDIHELLVEASSGTQPCTSCCTQCATKCCYATLKIFPDKPEEVGSHNRAEMSEAL